VSGYLAQLAALALGRAAAIRPAGPSRYAATPALETDASDGIVHHGAERLRDAPDPPRATVLRDHAPTMAAQDGARAESSFARDSFASVEAVAEADDDTGGSASVLARRPNAGMPPSSERAAGHIAIQHVAVPPPERAVDEMESEARVASAPLALRHTEAQPALERFANAGRSDAVDGVAGRADTRMVDHVADDTPSQPVRLLPLADAPHAPAVPPASANRAPQPSAARRGFDAEASRAADDEPADVYVHIGRIDVRAVAAPERRSAPAPGPASQKHSLAAYLRSRDVGRP
jgi:hypothetical protein